MRLVMILVLGAILLAAPPAHASEILEFEVDIDRFYEFDANSAQLLNFPVFTDFASGLLDLGQRTTNRSSSVRRWWRSEQHLQLWPWNHVGDR